jgi:hypothetical protein
MAFLRTAAFASFRLVDRFIFSGTKTTAKNEKGVNRVYAEMKDSQTRKIRKKS